MAKYFIQDETLTNLADKIRVLSGTEDTMTPDEMNNELTSANNEVDSQSALIDQLSKMLEGKASGGNGSSSGKIDTCTVSFIDAVGGECCIVSVTATIVADGACKTYVFSCNSSNYDERIYELTVSNVMCGTPINIVFPGHYQYRGNAYIEINGTAVYEGESEHYTPGSFEDGAHSVTFTSPTSANENCTIYYAYPA